jgi:PIN like domain
LRTLSVSPPAQRPEFWLDRSLGQFAVADRLRAAGWKLVTFAEYYGEPGLEQVTDSQWMSDAAGCGWPILMKDKRIRHRQAAIDLIARCQAQCFVITRDDLTSSQLAERFLANQRTIFEAAARPGPYIYLVQSGRLYPL